MYDVLYIEDNPDDADYLLELSEEIPEISTIDITETLATGISYIENNSYHIVFVDLSLPDSAGLEIIDRIKENSPDLPIIVFTGLNDQSVAVNAIKKGAQDYLMKDEFDEKLLKKSLFYALERHRNQQALAKAQFGLCKAEEMSQHGSWEFNMNGQVSMVSEGMKRIYQNNEKPFLTIDDYYKCILPEDRDEIVRHIQLLKENNRPICYTERIKRGDGQIRYLETRVELVRNKNDEAHAIFGASIDVTAVKRSEIKLKESEERLLEAQALANIGSWEYDVKTDTFMGSPQTYRILDMDRTVLYDPFGVIDELTLDENSRQIYSVIRDHLRKSNAFTLELKILTAKQNVKYIKINAKVYKKQTGDALPSLRGTIQDITILKEAELVKEKFTENLERQVEDRTCELLITKDKLEKSLEKEKELSEIKSRFVSTASHQFRTPLTVIQASVDLFEMQLEQVEASVKPSLTKAITRIGSEVERMTGLMNDILILGKVNNNSLAPVLEPVDIVGLLEYLIEHFNDIQSDQRNASLRVFGKPCEAVVDVNLLEHALGNLLSNAFKYSVGKPAPQVELSFESDAIVIVIKDHGIGIPKEDVQHLFEPFYRASNARQIKGTGLGTTIVKEYVELCNGTLDVESSVGKGSAFTVRLTKQQ